MPGNSEPLDLPDEEKPEKQTPGVRERPGRMSGKSDRLDLPEEEFVEETGRPAKGGPRGEISSHLVRIRGWWDNLSQRDRIILAAGTAAGLLVLAIFGCGILAALVGDSRAVAFKDGEVRYTSRVTRDQAVRLGKFLEAEGYFGTGDPKTVLLDGRGRSYQVKFVVKKGIDSDPVAVETFRLLGRRIAFGVFDGSVVEVHLCDEYLNTLRVVPV